MRRAKPRQPRADSLDGCTHEEPGKQKFWRTCHSADVMMQCLKGSCHRENRERNRTRPGGTTVIRSFLRQLDRQSPMATGADVDTSCRGRSRAPCQPVSMASDQSQTPHNLYYVKYGMCDDARTRIGQQACPALGANYDAVQSAADASSAAFTARAAVRAPVASKFRNSSSCASSPRLMHASTSPASVYRP